MSALVNEVIPGRADRILLAGVARSGTSWLIRAIAASPGTKNYYEPDNVDADPTGTKPAGGQGFGPYPLISPGDSGGNYRPLWDAAFAGRLPAVQNVNEGWKLQAARTLLKLPPAVRQPLVRTGAKVLSSLPGGPDRTAIKSIYAAFSLDWLAETYDPRVMVIQRHPMAVVSSWRQLQIPGFDLTTRPAILARYRDRFEGAAPGPDATELTRTAWQVGLLTTVIGDSLARHPGWLLIDHEDLCVDPVQRIRTVCERVEVPWTEEAERFLEESNRPGEGLKPQRVTKDAPTSWRGRLTDDEVEEITGVLDRFPRQGWIGERVSSST